MGNCEKIFDFVKECNDNGLRIGQVITNVFDLIAKDGYDPFMIEDDKLLDYFSKYMNN